MNRSLTARRPHDLLEYVAHPDRASCLEHQRLAELAILVADTCAPTAVERRPDLHLAVRFEFIDLIDRHYVRLCRRAGARIHPDMERSLQELRTAHERLRTDDELAEARMIVERHIERCPLTAPHES